MDKDLVDALIRRIDEAPRARIVLVKCLQVSPLLVSINGQGSYAAKLKAGSTFALNDTGYALWDAPLPPHCYKVT